MTLLAFAVQCLTNLARRGLFIRNLQQLHCLRIDSADGEVDAELPAVTMIVPARNEEAGIEQAVRSMAALDYPGLEIIVLDDHSTDATPEILDQLGSEFDRVRVVHNPPIQSGWLGKANAVWQGVLLSDPARPWLVIADADVVFHPKALRRAVAYATDQRLDYLTCVAYLDNGSFVEELMLPVGWCAIIQGARPDRLNHPRSQPIGVGAFVLVRRDAYLASGGHSAICTLQPEDTLLAGLIRRWGGTIGVVWTRDLMRVRLYRGYSQLKRFLVRKLRVQIDDMPGRLLTRSVYVLLQDVLPMPLAVYAAAIQWAAGSFQVGLTLFALGALASYLTNVLSFDQYRQVARMRRGIEWLHPLGGVLRLWFFASAVGQILTGQAMDWRGRRFVNG